MAKTVKILDCTLRDGGYIIDWKFGKKVITSILENLSAAGIDYIEAGFLKEGVNIKGENGANKDTSFWSSVEEFEKYAKQNQNYTLMVNYGEYSLKNFNFCQNPNIKIRVAFKKNLQNEALDYIKTLVDLGWDVFANPMSTNTYSDEELLQLIKKINKITPFGLSIVDTLGNMYEAEILDIIGFIDKNLSEVIAIDFHSHNNLQLSFSNTEALLKTELKRDLIVDSCLFGMGRGAGNLCTELITKYLNDHFEEKYNLYPIIKIINEIIKPIYNKKPWGYSTPYFIAAIHGCHPNYAGYLVDLGYSDDNIDKVMRLIPQEKKAIFDKNFLMSLI